MTELSAIPVSNFTFCLNGSTFYVHLEEGRSLLENLH